MRGVGSLLPPLLSNAARCSEKIDCCASVISAGGGRIQSDAHANPSDGLTIMNCGFAMHESRTVAREATAQREASPSAFYCPTPPTTRLSTIPRDKLVVASISFMM